MDCERCQQELAQTTYEGVEVTHCPTCESYWLTPSALSAVLTSQEVEFSKEQRHAALEQQAEPSEGDPLVFCVVCGAPTKRSNVLGLLLIDYCPGHGVWLDGGELERIQVIAETNEQWRKTLIKMVNG